MNNNISSYSSAGIYPVKLLQCKDLLGADNRIKPIHVQLNITNKCNLSCNFCSCKNRDKDLEMSYDTARRVIDDYKDLGCKAITLTGGGESLLHKDINEIIKHILDSGIKVGIVTNGININVIDSSYKITWIRVSFDDNREFNLDYRVNLSKAINRLDNIDWSFSYVVTRNPNFSKIAEIIKFANNHNFTHVRLVSDLLDLESVPSMSFCKSKLYGIVDDSKVIYQGRKAFTEGADKCLISLLKPVVDVDGNLYPCCGTMYSLDKPTRDYNIKMRMGNVKDIEEIYNNQRYFDGSNCVKCYYQNYNLLLKEMIKPLKHLDFV